MNSLEGPKTSCSMSGSCVVNSFPPGSSFLLLWRPEELCSVVPYSRQVPCTVGPRKGLQEEAVFEREASLGKPKLAPEV